ncbi:hypothetical protein GQ600_18598 [Phytophthora cactorum]|nr:hypothetical protein GQ600_18598 [Phytophthora cactorum]
MSDEAAGQETPGSAATDAQQGRSAEPCASRRRPNVRARDATFNVVSLVSRVSLSTSPDNPEQHRLQLVVQGVVKDTVEMRDSSGKMLDTFAANGATFDAIMHKLWEKFRCHIKGQAVKYGDAWTCVTPAESTWNKEMQFKVNGRIIPTTKSEESWNRWIASLHGKTVTLMIYTYGLEASIREVVERLREIWGATFQAGAAAWRMWANEIMRNLDRSTWEVAVLDPPTVRILPMLQAADARVEQHLADVTKSADLALDIVDASIKDNEQLHHHWEMFGMRLANQKDALAAGKRTLEGIRAGIPLPPLSTVIDPLATMENIEDTEQ